MSYKINLGQWGSVFAVPTAVVDKHIKLASAAQIKVLLYILRNSDKDISASSLSKELGLSAEEAESAVSFWVERELIADFSGELAPAKGAELTATVKSDTDDTSKQTVTEPNKSKTSISRAHRPDSAYVAKLLKEDAYIAGLLDEAQIVLKKPLSSGDTSVLVMLYSSFGLPCEVIAMLLNYLASIGRANIRSVERYGIRWSDAGIVTVPQAEREIERMQNAGKAWGRVSALYGIKTVGNPTKSQLEYADRWINTWNCTDELLTEAYERCVDTKGEYNIRYINAILQKWYSKGIKSLDALKASETTVKRSKRQRQGTGAKGSVFSAESASFDINEYENHSLFDD